jgi:hypothetical protein
MIITAILLCDSSGDCSRDDTHKSSTNNPATECPGQKSANGAKDRHKRKCADTSQRRKDMLPLQANQQTQQKRNAKVLEDRQRRH